MLLPDTITKKGFADDHLIRKKYEASNRNQEVMDQGRTWKNSNKHWKKWMDTMPLKLSSDKTGYIKFRSMTTATKGQQATTLNANGNLVNLEQCSQISQEATWTRPLSFKEHVQQKN